MPSTSKPYEIITNTIIHLLEEGVVPWRRPWKGWKAPKSLNSGKAYRGINVFTLSCLSSVGGYSSNYWLTYKQAKVRGGTVRKGEKGSPVVFWKVWQKTKEVAERGSKGDEEKESIPVLRYYNVFNVEQCDNVDYPQPEPIEQITFEPWAKCEAVYQQMPNKPSLEYFGHQPCYSLQADQVTMPLPNTFDSIEDYYATFFHELSHSTAHKSRLNRKTGKRFASTAYAREELVAEMGSAFLCGHCQIEQPVIENAAAYIQSWMAKISNDPKLVVLAAAQAQKAADYILGIER
jgi:antirestriction protein ArdC